MFPDPKKSFKRILILLSICLVSLLSTIVSGAEISSEITIRQESASAETYTYQLSAVTPDAPLPAENTLTLQGNAAGNYRLSFSSPGDYNYQITNLSTNESVAVRVHVTQTETNTLTPVIIAQNTKGIKLGEIVFSPPHHTPPILGIEDFSFFSGLFLILTGCVCIVLLVRAQWTNGHIAKGNQ